MSTIQEISRPFAPSLPRPNVHLNRLSNVARAIRRQPLSVTFPALLLVAIVGTTLFANWIAPYNPNTLSMQEMLAKPSSDHLLGTDQLGRDVLSRVLHGGRTTIMMSLIGTAAIALIGLVVGVSAGYIGGRFDLVVSTILTVVLSVPSLLLTLAILGMLGAGNRTLLIALVGAGWAGPARVFRAGVIALRESVYVEAAESLGASRSRILIRHIVPNLLTTVVVLATLDLGALILTVTSLSFLGLGVQPPNADWGTMLNEARTYFGQYPMLAIAPGLCITVVALLCNLVGDGIRDLVDIGR